MEQTKDQLDELETRVTAVPASSIAETHYCRQLDALDGTSLQPIAMCIPNEKVTGDNHQACCRRRRTSPA
jgi:hypothetical protein